MALSSLDEIFSSACTEVDRMIDRWMIGFVDPPCALQSSLHQS